MVGAPLPEPRGRRGRRCCRRATAARSSGSSPARSTATPGPGATRTPIAFVHATVAPGAELVLPWRPDFNALVYVLSGSGRAGADGAPVTGGQLAVFGAGDHLRVGGRRAAGRALEVVVLGGRPIGEPVAWYGPFVMNTRAELAQALDDFQSGRLGVVPPGALMPHTA